MVEIETGITRKTITQQLARTTRRGANITTMKSLRLKEM